MRKTKQMRINELEEKIKGLNSQIATQRNTIQQQRKMLENKEVYIVMRVEHWEDEPKYFTIYGAFKTREEAEKVRKENFRAFISCFELGEKIWIEW